ncbi:MAG: hypothetical protein EZS26_001725 [Candidatus Ordinivivax streblomastigis]|jgi:hypothetical protein|uniref:DUF3256 family protein n=1 Tax=Candidatus Ordinivivax streblomastigis TaxID=2540710 RepID=A0A5M8P138_9BACT|nr:MAG: hypothetical protein EZS26_001725 [Candidatus Ordinivivax streblomastigis]
MKRIVLLLLLGLTTAALPAQTVQEAFKTMPESFLPDLNSNARLDLLDLYRHQQQAIISNLFDDSLCLEMLTADYLRLNTGKASLQLIVLPMINESLLYCLITTACAPLCDSRIEFYSVSWNPLNTQTFIAATAFDSAGDENQQLSSQEISLMQWVYEPESGALLLSGNAIEAKTLHWNGIRFE